MKREVFISYSSKELKIAEDVCNYLEQKGTGCWIAPRNILPGAEYGEAIIDAIANSKVIVLIFSENSNSSQHVLREVERAVSKNVPIIAYKIDAATPSKSMEYFLLTNQWIDATTKGNHLSELHSSVQAIILREEKVVEQAPLRPIKSASIIKSAAPLGFAIAGIAILLTIIIYLVISNMKEDQKPLLKEEIQTSMTNGTLEFF